ncbi:hypothetical protein TrVE_jg12027 [Triparma verrucosa]|uniref:DUF4200 domain-containing protein n=2 Tax=Triparma TaxID=722752 RepID=A0A9W7ES65_9STRA|nr:hypothetical protein TrST_g12264 [Triparma strigata]GMH96371.1 hypothetical protein TrVE_jg12027 [Triparma verrucosa]
MSNEFLSTYGGRNKNLPQTLTLDHVSPATRLLEKRRQMFEVQEALDAQKEEFARREDAFRRREEALRKKDLELQESLIKFNKFLQENESKRNRAIKRAADEKKQREIKETEITKLTRQYHEKMLEEKTLKEQVLKNEKYQKFLMDVVEFVQGTSEDFPEVQDLLNRYNTLRVANEDLNKRQTNHDVENEEKRQQFAQFTKERANEVLNRNNEIATLQKNLEGHAMATLQAQYNVDSSISNMSDKVLQLGQMLASIENLLERFETQAKHMKRNKDTPKTFGDKADVSGSAEDLEREGKRAHEHLEDIAIYMIDYSSIVREWEAEITAGTQKQDF